MLSCAAPIKSDYFTVTGLSNPVRLIDSSAHGYSFGYAPSIIKVGATWHKYFCSAGTSDTAWDIMRHSTSTDLITWTPPVAVLTPSDGINERSCCDPSIVKFNRGDGEYYYLFYSGNKRDIQTVNFVARSAQPQGPFAKYTERGTWEVNAYDPKIIQYPFNAALEGSNVYGRGQPAVIVKDDVLHMWFSDNTETYPASTEGKVYLSTSRDAVTWARPVPTEVASWSIDVKYDVQAKTFIMFSGEAHHGQYPKMMIRVSDNGVHWSEPKSLFDMPNYAHNVGVSGGPQGELIKTPMLFAYGAPTNLQNDISWADWDLYGQYVGASVPTTSNVAPLVTAVATESIPGLSASNVTDGNNDTFYSSNPFASRDVTRPLYVAGWFGGTKKTVSKVLLQARMANGQPMCFPAKYVIHVTSPNNTQWVSLGEFTAQPNAAGVAEVNIGSRECYGVMILPTQLTADSYGNHYFQLSGISTG